MVFRLTKKAQTQLKNPSLKQADAENRYCEWFVNLTTFDRKKYFVMTNAYSFLSIVFPAKGICSEKAFYEIAYNELKNYFEKADIKEIFDEHIEPNTKNIYISATNNKSVVGNMNALIRYGKRVLYKCKNPFELNQRLNKYIVFFKDEFKGTIYPIVAITSDAMKETVRAYNYESEKTKQRKTKSPWYKNEHGIILTDPKKIAQDICWTAWDIPSHTKDGRKERKKLVGDALAYDENCTDAYCILAQDSTTYNQQLKYAKKAKRSFEKDYSDLYFAENMGHFYGILETRPYMRALWYYSEALLNIGEKHEAIEIMEYMLDLNANDNLGVRFQLEEIYTQDRNKEALAKLENRFKELEY